MPNERVIDCICERENGQDVWRVNGTDVTAWIKALIQLNLLTPSIPGQQSVKIKVTDIEPSPQP